VPDACAVVRECRVRLGADVRWCSEEGLRPGLEAVIENGKLDQPRPGSLIKES
jgi:hypothetical protein